MKKYLIQGALALVACATFSSCTHDDDFSGSIVDAKVQAYAEVFQKEFGTIDPNQDWGFGEESVLARTRAARTTRTAVFDYTLTKQDASAPNPPDQPGTTETSPHFRSTKPTSLKPEMPSYSSTLPSTYAKDVTTWEDGMTVYIDKNYHWIPDSKSLTVYVKDSLTFDAALTANGTGVTFVVLANKTLVLKSVNYKTSVYLHPGATLDLREIDQNYEFSSNGTEYGGIYMNSGSKILSKKLRIFNGYKLLNQGGTISSTSIEVDKSAVLWNEGSVSVTGNILLENEDAVFYNAPGKTVTASNLNHINNGNLMFNEGTLKISNNIFTTNSNGEVVNKGTITAASYDMSAGGLFLNDETGNVVIQGTTYITNLNCAWQNKGTYKTGDMDIENTRDVFNNCKLTVTASGTTGTGTFNFIKNSAFVLDGNNSVKTDKMTWGNDCDFYMSDYSLLWVVGNLLSKTKNKSYGLHGVGSNYSILKANSITYETPDQSRMNYYGNIFVDTRDHFEQGFVDDSENKTEFDQPYYYFDTTDRTVMFRFLGDVNPITSSIPASECYHGYNPGTSEDQTIPIEDAQESEEIQSQVIEWEETWVADAGRVFCEDLGVVSASDIDFNDIVFDAYIYNKQKFRLTREKIGDGDWTETTSELTNVTSWADVYVLAGGGTLEARIAGNKDVKGMFDSRLSDVTIVNTITSAEGSYGNSYVQYDYAGEGKDGELLDLNYSRIIDIPIAVIYNGNQFLILDAYKGVAPHKICVPIGTKWPKERAEINTAYESFNWYVKNRDSKGNYIERNKSDIPGPGNEPNEKPYQTEDSKSLTDVWNNPTAANIYQPDVTYTPRYLLEEGWENTGSWATARYTKQTYDSGITTTGGGTSGGYQGGDILVRRRH